MLSIGKLGQGQERYYLEAVAQGAEDYYTGAGEPPGRWMGSAARELGIGGEVESDGLRFALDGAHPRTGEPLAARRGGSRIPGFDLTFSAPKSVSVLYGLGDDALATDICAAHETAVDAALDYVERHAAVARRGAGGHESVTGNGFVAAAFRHRSSRAGDPQLHTHVLVANMTRGTDGRWSALDGRRLYAHAKTAGCLYEAHLRAELTRRIGVEWGRVRNGIADVRGIPQPVLRAFSRRRAEIDRALAERGEHSARSAQIATLDTRRTKDYDVEPASLRSEWQRRARTLGFELESRAVTGRAVANEPPAREVERIAEELASTRGLTSYRSSFTRREVIQAFCQRFPQGVDVRTAEQLADEFLAGGRTVPLATDVSALTHGDVIRRADSRAAKATTEERRHSTPELLETERRLLEGALARRGEGAGVVAEEAIDAALRRRPTLGEDQAAMVRRLAGDGDGVQVVCGRAGTGKTFALDTAREAWEAEGHRVIGAAVARRAARELQEGAGIESTSLAALLQDLRLGGEYGLPERSVVVLDEAGMAGTRQLAELLDHAEAAHAKVVLVGDPYQLPEIDAGGSFRALLTRVDAIELTDNRRQREPWEREALDHLREGRAEEAMLRYEEHGRIVLSHGAEDVRDRLVADWWQAAGEGDAAMIALRRSDVRDLNDRARALMRERGRLGSDVLQVGERDFAVGDYVVALKNAPRLDVVNGMRGVVTRIDAQAGGLALRTTDGRELELPRDYLESQTERGGPTVDHGYAITGHKAQGMTTDRAFVLGSDELYREWGYVAMSRGRVENRLYVVGSASRERDEYAPTERRPAPLDRVRSSLGHSRAQTAAIEHMTQAAVVKPPAHLVKELGSYPERRSERRAWERASLAIETYRSSFGIDDSANAFGPEPHDLRQASLWRDARREAARTRRELARGVERSLSVGARLGHG